ncbi:MAG: hypothetical protein OHK0015_40990 [Chloroflexi bacterium OHK40]
MSQYRAPSDPEEKPYAFVPLADPRVAQRQIAAGHHTVCGSRTAGLHTGFIEGVIVSDSPLHVATGIVEPLTDEFFQTRPDLTIGGHRRHDADNLVLPHTATRDGASGKVVRIIPGSTMKGLIRAVIEAITNPGMQFTPQRKGKKVENKVEGEQFTSAPLPPKLTVASRLFGITAKDKGYQGHCRFADAPQVSGGAELFRRLPLYSPRPGEAGPQFYFKVPDRVFKGRKFYRREDYQESSPPYILVESCRSGSKFRFRVDFDALSLAELGVILIALGAEHTDQGLKDKTIPYLKVGGGKPVAFGSVRFTQLRVHTLLPETYTDFESKTTELDIRESVEQAFKSGLLFIDGFDELRAIMTDRRTRKRGGCSPEERIY